MRIILSPAKKMNADTAFEGLHYRYSPEHSDDDTYVFVRQKEEKLPEFE